MQPGLLLFRITHAERYLELGNKDFREPNRIRDFALIALPKAPRGVVGHHRNRAEVTSVLPEVFMCNGHHPGALRP